VAERITIHPLNRGLRPLRLEVEAESGRITSARAGTTYYWDFEKTLRGKDPLDAVQITQRTNGLDFVAHTTASVRALEEMAGVKPPQNSVLCRNILLGLDIIYGHITHFYQTVVPDYVPFPPGGSSYGLPDLRINGEPAAKIQKNIWASFAARELIHRTMAVIGGKVPHICNVVYGGITYLVNSPDILKIQAILKDISRFITGEYADDLGTLENNYRDYFNIGAGAGNFLSTGEFTTGGPAGSLIPARALIGNKTVEVDKEMISMDCTGSKYKSLGPEGSLAAELEPVPDKPGGYSWVKGAVFAGTTCEVGALARMTVSGNPAIMGLGETAVSVLGRSRARFEECQILIARINGWLAQLLPDEEYALKSYVPEEGEAVGTAEASHGPVVHYVSVKNNKIHRYNVFDAFSWNLCPLTANRKNGPVEHALTGVAIAIPESPVEIYRVARSF